MCAYLDTTGTDGICMEILSIDADEQIMGKVKNSQSYGNTIKYLLSSFIGYQ
jgi:hypothetical protein